MLLLVAVARLGAQAPAAPVARPSPTTPAVATGAIAGRVLDKASGQPVLGAQVTAGGSPRGVSTDLDGRFRLVGVPVGRQQVLVRRIGFAPARLDSVVVREGTATVVTVVLEQAVARLDAVRIVEAEVPRRTNSEEALLAVQRQAAAVTDGVSAEQIGRTPDSDAADAMKRVTGVSVLDEKYIVVRGLNERWNNTQLNGAELPSPEPLRKVVPFDIFPASLLESVVTSKTATPDRPGDFAGGSVEIRTKEFPENFVLQASISQSYNSIATLDAYPAERRRGLGEHLGFGLGRHSLPAGAPRTLAPASERYVESIRNVWTPGDRRVAPGIGLSFNVGGQARAFGQPIGSIFTFTYGSRLEVQPDRLWQLSLSGGTAAQGQVYRETTDVVDWGAIFNTSLRLGAWTKLGFKNLYTRNAEAQASTYEGFDLQGSDLAVRGYQMRYVERDFLQSQLSGEHVLPFLAGSRLEWKGTAGFARRDEPDNRAARYLRAGDATDFTLSVNNRVQIRPRYLDDRQWSVQGDYLLPVAIAGRTVQLKAGGSNRDKRRDFTAYDYEFVPIGSAGDIPPMTGSPELAFAPENLGRYFDLVRLVGGGQPYRGSEVIDAAYGMVDLPLPLRIRLVGGARMESWHARLAIGDSITRGSFTGENPFRVDRRDVLPSGNLTIALTDAMNLRLAAFRSVNRPDLRELAPDQYAPLAGECPFVGNPALDRTSVLNGDMRWEWYPAAGELLAVSGFRKTFERPIVETVDTENAACRVSYRNADAATVHGAEVELRKALGFLPGPFAALFASANATLVTSRVEMPDVLGIYPRDLPLQGQAPVVFNLGLSWSTPASGRDASLFYNAFADRVVRYGIAPPASNGAAPTQLPNVVERGRGSLDVKVRQRVRGTTLSLSGANLMNASIRHEVKGTGDLAAIVVAAQRIGRTFGMSIGHDF